MQRANAEWCEGLALPTASGRRTPQHGDDIGCFLGAKRALGPALITARCVRVQKDQMTASQSTKDLHITSGGCFISDRTVHKNKAIHCSIVSYLGRKPGGAPRAAGLCGKRRGIRRSEGRGATNNRGQRVSIGSGGFIYAVGFFDWPLDLFVTAGPGSRLPTALMIFHLS